MISSREEIAELLSSLKEDQSAFRQTALELLDHILERVNPLTDKDLYYFIEKEKKKLFVQSKRQEKSDEETFKEIRDEYNQLVKEFNQFTTTNYLLEYKQKDLMLLANDLEEVNEELEKQKKHIEKQADELRKSHREILEINEELQSQNDYILDQSDYLHEANERISKMHEEVQAQKEEILRKNEELVNLNKEKNNLIGIVAHDLKSPLNQIKGLITIIKFKKDQLDTETVELIETIEKSAVRLSDMINKILDVEAIESKKLNIKLEDVDLKELLKEIANNFGVLADKKNIKINLELKGGKPVVRADRNYALQIFENLVSNAIKFSEHDKNIYFKLNHSKGKVICEIRDESPGLSEQDKKLLFSKYQKLSARPTGDELSTGLGLSIVKKFTESMGGEIWYESELGKGTSFFVSFPLVKNVLQQ